MKIIFIFSANKALKNFISTCAISVRFFLTGDHIIIIKFCWNRRSVSMADKTVNLKESIPASLLFCCYLCAKVTARLPPCPATSVEQVTGPAGHLFSQHHLPHLPMDQLEPVLPRADQALGKAS